jgi:hypothetical protein
MKLSRAMTICRQVEAQYTDDWYRIRKQLDPNDATCNDMMWHAAERIRHDFYLSGVDRHANICRAGRVGQGDP